MRLGGVLVPRTQLNLRGRGGGAGVPAMHLHPCNTPCNTPNFLHLRFYGNYGDLIIKPPAVELLKNKRSPRSVFEFFNFVLS